MDVILDTNIYYALIQRDGRGFAETNVFRELITYLRRKKSDLIIPGVVYEELNKKYVEIVAKSIKAARDSWNVLARNMMSEVPDFLATNLTAEALKFESTLLKPATGFRSKLLEDYGGIDVKEVVHRGVHRVRPANDNGEELRDVILWLSVLKHAQQTNQKIAFISDDNTFKNADGSLHPDLIKDLRKLKVEVAYYRSISLFIADNSLASDPITNKEMKSLVTSDEIANLVESRMLNALLSEGLIQTVSVLSSEFDRGRKYKVSEDSSYIEATYKGSAKFSAERQLNFFLNPSFVHPGFNQTLNQAKTPWMLDESFTFNPATPQVQNPTNLRSFVTLGDMPITLTPPKTSTDYLCTFDLRISLRTVNEKRESLEVDRLQLDNIILASEDPTLPQ